jgi:hypothetical protein
MSKGNTDLSPRSLAKNDTTGLISVEDEAETLDILMSASKPAEMTPSM